MTRRHRGTARTASSLLTRCHDASAPPALWRPTPGVARRGALHRTAQRPWPSVEQLLAASRDTRLASVSIQPSQLCFAWTS